MGAIPSVGQIRRSKSEAKMMISRRRRSWLLSSLCIAFVACATAATQPPSVDVTGNWAGEWIGLAVPGNGPVTMTLAQTGANVTGDIVMGGGSPYTGRVSGTVSGDDFSISYPGGRAHFAVKGNEMTGASPYSRWTLKRQ
jgi:hypothetical protein